MSEILFYIAGILTTVVALQFSQTVIDIISNLIRKDNE